MQLYVLISGVTRVGDTRGGNWGCHPSIFFPKNLATFFCSSLSLSLSLFIAFTRVSPPPWCHHTFFYLSDLVSPLFFVNLPTKFFFLRVSPPWRVSPGRSAPPSDATGPNLHKKVRKPEWILLNTLSKFCSLNELHRSRPFYVCETM